MLGADHLDDVYWSGRTCLVTGHADIPAYDAAFASFFLGSELQVSSESGEDPESPPGEVTTSDPSGERSSFVDSAAL